MMTLRRVVMATLVAPLATALVACASTTAGTPHASTPGSGGGSSGVPAGTQEFAARITAAMQQVTSAHIDLTVTLSGSPIPVTGDEKLSNGTLTAYDLSETLPGNDQLRLLYVDGKTYAQPPASLNDTGKPWVLVSPTSSNAFARTLAATLGQVQSSASINSFAVLSTAASDLRTIGNETINGAPATHYAFTVQVAKLPDSFAGKQLLQQAGITTLPIEVWLDAQNRPVKALQRIAVSGQSSTTTILVSDFDKPVTITAPPATQVSTN